MKRDKKNMDEILKRQLPRASREDAESARARVLQRLRRELQGVDFNMSAPETPATKVLRRFRLIDELVLTAVRMLEAKVTLSNVCSIANELAGEALDAPLDLNDVSLSITRLDRQGRVSIRSLFPEGSPLPEAQPQELDGLADETS